MVKTASEKKTCLKCGNDYAVSSFYSHRNPLLHERFGFCKKCVKGNVDLNSMETLYSFLRTMDIPYLKEFWKQANESDTETIGTYLKNLNSLRQNKELRFKDSDDISGKTNKAELLDIDTDFELTDDVVKKWGRNLEMEDYVFLEEEFENLGGDQAEDTLQERLFKNMAKTQWMANKAYEEGDHTKYEKMMKTLSTQMQDANIKPVQLKSSGEESGLKTWGEWVRLVEETEPISEVQENFKDVDGIHNYMQWFIIQLKRVFGKATDEDLQILEVYDSEKD